MFWAGSSNFLTVGGNYFRRPVTQCPKASGIFGLTIATHFDRSAFFGSLRTGCNQKCYSVLTGACRVHSTSERVGGSSLVFFFSNKNSKNKKRFTYFEYAFLQDCKIGYSSLIFYQITNSIVFLFVSKDFLNKKSSFFNISVLFEIKIVLKKKSNLFLLSIFRLSNMV